MFYTYLIAALAATLAAVVVDVFATVVLGLSSTLWVMDAGPGDSDTIGGAADWAVTIAILIIANWIFLGLGWTILGSIVAAFKKVKFFIFVVRGVLANLLMAMLLLVFTAPFIGLGVESVADGIMQVAMLVLGGAAWGAVFWMRAPKSVAAVAA